MGRTLEMFDKPKAKRVRRMRVIDAGEGAIIVRYGCARCGHETDWMDAPTVTTAKRGIPCPHCNV